MTRIFRTLLFLSLVLAACSPITPSPESGSSATATTTPSIGEAAPTGIIPVITKEVLPLPKLAATLATPHIEQGPDGAVTAASNPLQCAYQWAQQDLPGLSADFLTALQTLQPEAQGNAYAFGENCHRPDGSVTFGAMETDFNVTLQVKDLSDAADLGEWIVKVMQVIEGIPRDQIVGPRPGRVSLTFNSNGDSTGILFYIDQYHSLPAGLSSAEIFQTLQTP